MAEIVSSNSVCPRCESTARSIRWHGIEIMVIRYRCGTEVEYKMDIFTSRYIRIHHAAFTDDCTALYDLFMDKGTVQDTI